MSSVYRLIPSKNNHISIKLELKNNIEHWFVDYIRGGHRYKLVSHELPILIRHIYVLCGMSKMIKRDYEEIYKLVKSRLELVSGDDIIEQHHL
jgi:hypothetical protein